MKIWWKPKERAYPDPEHIAESKIASLQDGITDFDGLHAYNRLRVPVGVDMYVVESPPEIITVEIDYTCWTANRHANGDVTWYTAWSREYPYASPYYGETDYSPPVWLYTAAIYAILPLGTGYACRRAKLSYDNTGLASKVLSAQLRLWHDDDLDHTGAGGGVHIVGGSGLAEANTYSDYGILRTYTDIYASKAQDDISVNSYHYFDLNQLGIDYINSAITASSPIIIGIREHMDYANTTPINGVLESSHEWGGPGQTVASGKRPTLTLGYA